LQFTATAIAIHHLCRPICGVNTHRLAIAITVRCLTLCQRLGSIAPNRKWEVQTCVVVVDSPCSYAVRCICWHRACVPITCVKISWHDFGTLLIDSIDAMPIKRVAHQGRLTWKCVIIVACKFLVVMVRLRMSTTHVLKQVDKHVRMTTCTHDFQRLFGACNVHARGNVTVVLASRRVIARIRWPCITYDLAIFQSYPFLSKAGFKGAIDILSLHGPAHGASCWKCGSTSNGRRSALSSASTLRLHEVWTLVGLHRAREFTR
jgi:hypothetical protein